jgi:hypothetical protein
MDSGQLGFVGSSAIERLRMVSSKKRLLQRMRVPLGFAFAILFLYFAAPTPIWLAVGGAIAVCGL